MEKAEIRESIALKGDIFKHYTQLAQHFDTRANWLTSLSGIIIIYAASNFNKLSFDTFSFIGALVLLVGSIIAISNFILILVPSINILSKDKNEKDISDIFSHSNIRNNYSEEDLIKYIALIESNPKELNKAYGTAIHRIAAYRLPLIVKRIKMGGWVLMGSLIVGCLLIMIGFLQ